MLEPVELPDPHREGATQVPAGARVLGEWHIHPKGTSSALSPEDVRGANANRHFRCYVPYYATPDGTVYAWNVHASSTLDAMVSRVRIETADVLP